MTEPRRQHQIALARARWRASHATTAEGRAAALRFIAQAEMDLRLPGARAAAVSCPHDGTGAEVGDG
jgi:hypothetical protein